ncbi:hypothetical protein [Nocardioides sp. AX2bis]|uniref:hypothetical protein n=1 Tax=Nocardioides sp. AX2bis TaxID=2653157 RepID=UPI0012EF3995|nr:hypothetical protein [Nocardioides sp. AX2bis]VXC44129.1 conserved hypothetical protein [Nocardioides sp. AX2bis]
MTVSRLVVAKALMARLDGITWATAHLGAIDTAKARPVDADGRVSPYVVLYPGLGRVRDAEDTVTGSSSADLALLFQLTCVAGVADALLDLFDAVHDQVHLWSPGIAGIGGGRFRTPPGYDPGPMRRNDQANPPRFWSPMQYQLDTTS